MNNRTKWAFGGTNIRKNERSGKREVSGTSIRKNEYSEERAFGITIDRKNDRSNKQASGRAIKRTSERAEERAVEQAINRTWEVNRTHYFSAPALFPVPAQIFAPHRHFFLRFGAFLLRTGTFPRSGAQRLICFGVLPENLSPDP